MKKFFHLFFLLFSSFSLRAQQFGGHPPSTKWKQINTDTVRVIFPDLPGLDKQAADVVSIAHQLASGTHLTIGDRLRKISIVLQPKTTISNGYVGLGPRRSEFQLTTPQNSFQLGSLPWHKFLAWHEYRHIQQFNNFQQGISGAFYYLFGEDGLSLAASAAVPNWFWEGDAVFQETLVSEQGRGRLPFFHNEYRSLWLANKNYSWMKLRNGSLRDFVPDHYRLGYMMVAYGRQKYGEDFWKKVTDDAVRYKGLFYPFQQAVKKYSGKPFKEFRKEAMDYFQSAIPANKNEKITNWAGQQPRFVGDEEYPQWVGDDSLVLVKSSYRKIPAFYVRNVSTGDDRRVRTKDISLNNYFSYRNGKVVYAAFEPDTRWAWKNYSVLKILDINTGTQKTITHRSAYFAPDISGDGQQVVAVDVQPGDKATLHILSTKGALLKRIPNPQNVFYTYPKFYNDQTVVAAIRNANGAMTIGLINTADGAIEELTPWSMNVAGFTAVQGDTITFTASHGNRDELFAIINKKLFRHDTKGINTGTGNYQLSTRNNKAVWTAFTAAGFRITAETLAASSWIPVSDEQYTTGLYTFDLRDPDNKKTFLTDSTVSYPITNYAKSFRLFNFHSWRPFINDPDYTFSVIGQNVLNTLQSEVYFNYNTNEKYKQVGAGFLYGGWFPYLSVNVSGTFDRSVPDTSFIRTWNEYSAGLGLQLPLNLTSGPTYRNMNVSATINTRQISYTGQAKNGYANAQFNFADFSFSFTQQSQVAQQHIYPRLANSFFTRYRTIVDKYTGNQWLTSNSLYLPGILASHNLVIAASYQSRDTMQQYLFSNSFPFSRGYTDVNAPRMWKVGFNYHFPLLYPDWGLGNIVYFLRVRANGFYDYTDIKSVRTGNHFQFRSAGSEIFFDTKWWNEYEVSFGFRYSRLFDGELLGLAPNQWAFILPVNLLSR